MTAPRIETPMPERDWRNDANAEVIEGAIVVWFKTWAVLLNMHGFALTSSHAVICFGADILLFGSVYVQAYIALTSRINLGTSSHSLSIKYEQRARNNRKSTTLRDFSQR